MAEPFDHYVKTRRLKLKAVGYVLFNILIEAIAINEKVNSPKRTLQFAVLVHDDVPQNGLI
jgi:hypothetical protein